MNRFLFSLACLLCISSFVFGDSNASVQSIKNTTAYRTISPDFVYLKSNNTVVTKTTTNPVSTKSVSYLPKKQNTNNKQTIKQKDFDVNQKVLDIVVGRLDNTVEMLGYLMAGISAFFGLIIAVGQYFNHKNTKEDIKERFDTIRESLDSKRILSKMKDGLNDEVEKKINEVFKNDYDEKISNYVNSKVQETIMQTPKARGLTLSRFRRMDNELQKTLAKEIGEEASNKIYSIIATSIRDWEVISELHSADKDKNQLQSALQKVISNPFPEVYNLLGELKDKYNDDMDIFPLVKSAHESVEKEVNKQANNCDSDEDV